MPYLYRRKSGKSHSCKLPGLYTTMGRDALPSAGDLWKCRRCKTVYEVIEHDWWNREWRALG